MTASPKRLISSGSPFEAEFASSRAVVQGDWRVAAGAIGRDSETGLAPERAEAQVRAALTVIGRALAEAGFVLADVVRTVIHLPNPADHPAIAPALREAFGDSRPANATVCAPLLRPELQIEIEVTAFRG